MGMPMGKPPMYISTHSLTKRLTKTVVAVIGSLNISTHSLTKRLTDFGVTFDFYVTFQLTASRRG